MAEIVIFRWIQGDTSLINKHPFLFLVKDEQSRLTALFKRLFLKLNKHRYELEMLKAEIERLKEELEKRDRLS